jgi:hypothetical protein
LLLRAVPHRVERVGNAVTEVIRDLGQAVRGIVGIVKKARIRKRDPRELACVVIGVGRRLPAYVSRGQPLARVVRKCRHQPIGIGDRERLAVGVVVGNLRDVPGRVGDALDLTAATDRACPGTGRAVRVVRIGRHVRDIGAWTVHRQDLAIRVVGIGPGAGRAYRRCGKAQGPIGIARGLDRAG